MQTPLMSQRRRKRFTVTQENGSTYISLGEMEIWDGADLALIRDTLFEQILDFNRRDIALDMKTVKYIPSGFFGMLGDWKDRGIDITIYGVQNNVRQMLWFQQFFTELRPGCFRLETEPKYEMASVFRDDEADHPLANVPVAATSDVAEKWNEQANETLEEVAC